MDDTYYNCVRHDENYVVGKFGVVLHTTHDELHPYYVLSVVNGSMALNWLDDSTINCMAFDDYMATSYVPFTVCGHAYYDENKHCYVKDVE